MVEKSRRRQLRAQISAESVGPFAQGCERRIQHLAGFEARERRCIDAHALGDLGEGQLLRFACGSEFREQRKDRCEALLIDSDCGPRYQESRCGAERLRYGLSSD